MKRPLRKLGSVISKRILRKEILLEDIQWQELIQAIRTSNIIYQGKGIEYNRLPLHISTTAVRHQKTQPTPLRNT